MKILGCDFESQDDDARTTNVTEVGASLVEDGRYLHQISALCYLPEYPPQTEFIVELTGITDEMLKTTGMIPKLVFEKLLFPLVEEAEYVFAHNKSFDETVYNATSERYGLTPPKRPWICTVTEIDYPRKYTCKKLSHLAFDHGLVFDPSLLHRSLDDVKLMLQLLALYKLEDIIAYANEPWIYIQALFPPPFGTSAAAGLVGKAKAQKLGYGWEKAKGDEKVFAKQWMKRVKKRHVADEQAKAQKLSLDIRTLSI